jgi:hypothetical protein
MQPAEVARSVTLFEAPEMFARPDRVSDFDRADRRARVPGDTDGYCQPAGDTIADDAVAIAPITPGELHLVDCPHDVEVSLPRDIVRLKDGN